MRRKQYLGAFLFLLATQATPVFAQEVSFANFTQSNQSLKLFKYIRNSSSLGNSYFFLTNSPATGTVSQSIAVNFEYGVANGYDIGRGSATGTNIAATMTFTAFVDGPVVQVGSLFAQKIRDVEIAFTANTAVFGQTNLLTVSGDFASFTGSGTIANIDGQTTAGQSVNFSSAFLDFSNTVDRSFQLNVIAIDTLPIGPPTTLSRNTNGTATTADDYLNSYVGTVQGQFSTNPPPDAVVLPEPGTASLFGFALLPVVLRRRKATGTGQ